jgi:hypothetical protein
MVKPFFRDSQEKWPSAFKMDKMATNGGLRIHLKKAPKLSKEWGEGQAERCKGDMGAPAQARRLKFIES